MTDAPDDSTPEVDLTKPSAAPAPAPDPEPVPAPAPARADRAATFPDRATAQWAVQQVIALNEQTIHRWLAQSTRRRLVVEAAWPSRTDPVGTVLTTGMMLAGQQPIEVRAARVVLLRAAADQAGVPPFSIRSFLPVIL
ncbi:RNase A-like domain-containing protein [Streptomyces sp. NPDC090025]|uniref:RNase A-like domain-containing protein n=1 Tax=Streptomyces sp. NPDC090025 TaxID=3365922 RepID=UPI003835E082